jgi:hypothetical protein
VGAGRGRDHHPHRGGVSLPSDFEIRLPFNAGENVYVAAGYSPSGGSSLHATTDNTGEPVSSGLQLVFDAIRLTPGSGPEPEPDADVATDGAPADDAAGEPWQPAVEEGGCACAAAS